MEFEGLLIIFKDEPFLECALIVRDFSAEDRRENYAEEAQSFREKSFCEYLRLCVKLFSQS